MRSQTCLSSLPALLDSFTNVLDDIVFEHCARGLRFRIDARNEDSEEVLPSPSQPTQDNEH